MPGNSPKIQPIHPGDAITAKVLNSFTDVLMEVIKVGPGLGMKKAQDKIVIYSTRKPRTL